MDNEYTAIRLTGSQRRALRNHEPYNWLGPAKGGKGKGNGEGGTGKGKGTPTSSNSSNSAKGKGKGKGEGGTGKGKGEGGKGDGKGTPTSSNNHNGAKSKGKGNGECGTSISGIGFEDEPSELIGPKLRRGHIKEYVPNEPIETDWPEEVNFNKYRKAGGRGKIRALTANDTPNMVPFFYSNYDFYERQPVEFCLRWIPRREGTLMATDVS